MRVRVPFAFLGGLRRQVEFPLPQFAEALNKYGGISFRQLFCRRSRATALSLYSSAVLDGSSFFASSNCCCGIPAQELIFGSPEIPFQFFQLRFHLRPLGLGKEMPNAVEEREGMGVN